MSRRPDLLKLLAAMQDTSTALLDCGWREVDPIIRAKSQTTIIALTQMIERLEALQAMYDRGARPIP